MIFLNLVLVACRCFAKNQSQDVQHTRYCHQPFGARLRNFSDFYGLGYMAHEFKDMP